MRLNHNMLDSPFIRLLAIILACSGTGIVSADAGFDRFFTDKKTRMQLDQAREQHSFISPRGSAAVDQAEELVLPDVRLDGMIIRNDGSAKVWINSTGSIHEENLGDKVERDAHRAKDGSIRITLPSGKTVKLKPGQVYSMEAERVREAYEKIHEPPAAENPVDDQTETSDTAENAQMDKEPEVGFNEAALLEDPDAKIKLLEDRVQKLEQASERGRN